MAPLNSARRRTFLPFHLPSIGEEEVAAVCHTLRSGWLTSGPKVAQFEHAFAEALGVRHAIAVNSCTAALHLALEAIGVKQGDEVIVPTMTFTATAEAALHLHACPVLADSSPDSINMDPESFRRAITPRTKAVIPVHYAGNPCEMDLIRSIAAERGIAVIEDAAHGFPASYKGRPVGRLGHAACFSFYATKTITTGEGGMVVTDDDRLAEHARSRRLHGISRDAWRRKKGGNDWRYDIPVSGFKCNMTDIAAAIGIEQLRRTGELTARRREIAAAYRAGLAALPFVSLFKTSSFASSSDHLFIVRLELERLAIDRDRFFDLLIERNIGVGVHPIPLHEFSYYREEFGYRSEQFPVATDLFSRILSLPIYPGMTDEDVADVLSAVREVAAEHAR